MPTTITGTYVDQTGAPPTGEVTFRPTRRHPSSSMRSGYVAKLDSNGSFSITLPSTNDPAVSPVPFTYEVQERTSAEDRRVFEIDATGSTLALHTVAPDVGAVAGKIVRFEADRTATAKRIELDAAIAELPKSYGPVVGIARRLAASGVMGSDTAVSPLSPTVTFSAHNAAPTIVGGVRIAPMLASPTVIDTANDPHFEFTGAIPGRILVSSGDMAYADVLTGGTSQAARNHPRIKFDYTGQVFEAYWRTRGTTFDYRIWVDGLPLTVALASAVSANPGRHYLKVDFGSAAPRRIEFEVVDPEFGGIVIEPTASITRPKASLLLAGFGDSHTRGANGVNWMDTWVRRAANMLRCDWVNLGIGGSGYLNGTVANYRNRLTTDIVPVAPDVLVFEGGWNDSAASTAAVQEEAAYCFDTLKASLPNALLIAAGPWVRSHNVSPVLDAHDAALRAQVQASGWHGYISYRDPARLKPTSAAWAQNTAYGFGAVVTQNGFAQTCISAHTSGASFDQTKWRSTAIVTGTGRVGATTGDGSADVLVSSDAIHSTALGHQVKARHVAAEVLRIARAVAAGRTWAG